MQRCVDICENIKIYQLGVRMETIKIEREQKITSEQLKHEPKTRLDYLDIAKGFAMICIIMGHMGLEKVNSFVFTFHVPIFFLISGYFLNTRLSFGDFLRNMARQLLITYTITCICIIGGGHSEGGDRDTWHRVCC